MTNNIVTVEWLSKKTSAKLINNEILNVAKTIDSKIKEAHSVGLNNIKYELPEIFTIPNMEREDIQLVIYSKLITMFEDAGFTVYIETNIHKTFLYIKWINQLEDSDRKEMLKIINDHAIKK